MVRSTAAGLRTASEHSGEEGHRINTERASDRNELRHIDTTLERLDPLDPVRGNSEFPRQLSLGELSVPAGRGDGGGDGPMAARVFHSGALRSGEGRFNYRITGFDTKFVSVVASENRRCAGEFWVQHPGH